MKIAEHKRRALKAGNGGSFTPREWRELKARYGNRCLRCGVHESESVISMDHVLPLSLGGTNDIANIQPLCKPCNSWKNAKHIDYRP
jgi:5-methylcytosine-specific restriction endonuclease McrA